MESHNLWLRPKTTKKTYRQLRENTVFFIVIFDQNWIVASLKTALEEKWKIKPSPGNVFMKTVPFLQCFRESDSSHSHIIY